MSRVIAAVAVVPCRGESFFDVNWSIVSQPEKLVYTGMLCNSRDQGRKLPPLRSVRSTGIWILIKHPQQHVPILTGRMSYENTSSPKLEGLVRSDSGQPERIFLRNRGCKATANPQGRLASAPSKGRPGDIQSKLEHSMTQ